MTLGPTKKLCKKNTVAGRQAPLNDLSVMGQVFENKAVFFQARRCQKKNEYSSKMNKVGSSCLDDLRKLNNVNVPGNCNRHIYLLRISRIETHGSKALSRFWRANAPRAYPSTSEKGEMGF